MPQPLRIIKMFSSTVGDVRGLAMENKVLQWRVDDDGMGCNPGSGKSCDVGIMGA